MKPDLIRPLISMAGLAIGFGLYALAGKLSEPWQNIAVGGMFMLLGISAWIYAAGERWIQVLAALLLIWGVLRAFFLH